MRALFSPMLLSTLFACGPDVSIKMTENLPPDGVINSPTTETVFPEGQVIEFVGTVADSGGLEDIQSVTWTSSVDFELGSDELSEPDSDGKTRLSTLLSPGTHVITLSVVDFGGLAGSDSVTVTVTAAQQEPTAEILSPDNFARFYVDEEINFTAVVEDEQDSSTDLALSWTAENTDTGYFQTLYEGSPAANGAAELDWAPDEEGNYVVTLTVEDTEKNVGTAELYVIVTDAGDEDLDGDGWTPNTGDCDDTNNAVNPGMTEICADNLDNDCNGSIDDKDVDADGHIDEACVNYTGTMPLDDCDDEDFNTHPGSTEILDGADNDCDGEIDDGTDAYDNDGDCFCVSAPCTGSISTGCSTIDGGDCDDTDNSVHPDALDTPDLDYIDHDCDGMDGDKTNGVYLDPVSGKDTASGGTSSKPVKTLDEAFSKAKSSGRDWIYVASGSLSLSGTFDEGINIAGGYDASAGWSRKSSILPTLVTSTSGVVISGWTTATEWQQIGIIANANTSKSGSSFALRVINSKDLTINGCEIESGDAGIGLDGANGTSGASGKNGTRGDDGVEDSNGLCDSNPNPYGGSYGAGGSTCSTARGGQGGNPGLGTGTGKSGSAAPSGGAGGAGGGNGKDGSKGLNGARGSNGSNGAGGTSYGTWTTSGYTASNGKNGSAGQSGKGGGGGGGGGGGDAWCDSWGGGGGGGGGGGCGGGAGTAGMGGGSSVAILLSNSNISIKSSSLFTGNGGDGGDGGDGAGGGNGGSGGVGGKYEDDSGNGGAGGAGGAGGTGGHGGGGGGGPSIGIVCTSSSTVSVDSVTNVTLGNGGAGGASKGASGQTGRRADTSGC